MNDAYAASLLEGTRYAASARVPTDPVMKVLFALNAVGTWTPAFAELRLRMKKTQS